MTCPTCSTDGICTQGCAKGERPKPVIPPRKRATVQTTRAALNQYNRTAIMLMFQFNAACVELETIMHLFGYLSKTEAYRAATAGDLPVPVWKARDSNKAPYLVNLEDLANWMDKQRATAQHEMDSWTKTGRKAA